VRDRHKKVCGGSYH